MPETNQTAELYFGVEAESLSAAIHPPKPCSISLWETHTESSYKWKVSCGVFNSKENDSSHSVRSLIHLHVFGRLSNWSTHEQYPNQLQHSNQWQKKSSLCNPMPCWDLISKHDGEFTVRSMEAAPYAHTTQIRHIRILLWVTCRVAILNHVIDYSSIFKVVHNYFDNRLIDWLTEVWVIFLEQFLWCCKVHFPAVLHASNIHMNAKAGGLSAEHWIVKRRLMSCQQFQCFGSSVYDYTPSGRC